MLDGGKLSFSCLDIKLTDRLLMVIVDLVRDNDLDLPHPGFVLHRLYPLKMLIWGLTFPFVVNETQKKKIRINMTVNTVTVVSVAGVSHWDKGTYAHGFTAHGGIWRVSSK